MGERSAATSSPAYRDAALAPAERVDDLIGRMTLAEKVGQLNQRLLGWHVWSRSSTAIDVGPVLDSELERWGSIGAIYGLSRADAWSGRGWDNGADPEISREVTAIVQERIVGASRLGIPALFVEEAPHGHQALGSQLFPVNLAAGAAWRPDLVEEAAAHIAHELRARGAHLALVSGLDVVRDPRWGRAEECFGEDPYLAASNVAALVRGIGSRRGVGAVLKHFAGQGAGIGGRNGSGAPIGRRELREIHLPAARAGIEAGAAGVMAAYNDIDGVPCVADGWLLTDVLRGEWGFDGIVMADMHAVDRLQVTVPTGAAAAALAVRAGVDMSLADASFADLPDAVESGLLDEALVDRACRRVLALKMRLGLLDAPSALPAFPPPTSSRLPAGGPVLLQNRGTLLPLPADARRIAVIGPNAADEHCLLGDYVPPLLDGVASSLLDEIRIAATAEVVHELGCTLTGAAPGGTGRAAALAGDADVAVVVLGGTSERRYSDDFDVNGAALVEGATPVATTGEGVDAAEVELPAAQLDLVEAVAATGTPLVAVIVAGRPHGIGRVAEVGDAVLYVCYPGPDGGRVIADVLFGRAEPTGRLPVSLPARSAVLPVAYNLRVEHADRYVDAPAAADFPFGAGLGYTAWELGAATAVGDAAPAIALSAPLRNAGGRRGSQVVQLYLRALVPGVVSRRAALAGYVRVTLDPGESTMVSVAADPTAVSTLGLPPDRSATVECWLSISGAEPRPDALRLVLPSAVTRTDRAGAA